MASGKMSRSGKIARKVSGFIVVLALGCAAPLPSLAQGTDEQREACTPDAFRLCAMAIPDERRVEDCLRRSGSRLSPACYAVFFPPPPPTTLAQPRGPGQGQRASRQQPMQQQPTQPLPPLPSPDDDD